MWFGLAAAQDHKKATNRRSKIAKKMTPKQIEEAERLAKEWMSKH